ncbi:hypothetical protein CRG98_035637 [Punica granatum]|uniref:LOB domain-containing protein n=1 Tax=Punica granatum TaxID=22663 RepID=A0A2I0IIW1_PUNGR|nr:hypothetical protein CRG98_035637 [Punica granatum]
MELKKAKTHACAACKYQRRKCTPDCLLAPYFPHDHTRQFQNAHKLFGVSKITKIIEHLGPLEKDEAMRTIIYQSDARAHDPVSGCYGMVRDLQRQIELCQAELELVLRQLDFFRQQEAAAALGCDLMSGPNATAATSTDPFVQAFGALPSDEPHQANNNGLVDEFNVNHNNVNSDAVAWAMQDCSSPTSNGNNGVNVMPHHHQQHQQLFHQHVGDGSDDHDNDNGKQMQGFNMVDQCNDMKPLILDLPPDDHREQHHDLGFSSDVAINRSKLMFEFGSVFPKSKLSNATLWGEGRLDYTFRLYVSALTSLLHRVSPTPVNGRVGLSE